MFTTPEEVKVLTGYTVDSDAVFRAQVIIESFIGKVEADVDSPSDQALLGRATAYQAAYMAKHYETVYEQMAVTQIAQQDGGVKVNQDMISPWLAPLAVVSLRNLSWRKSRSVHTGAIFQRSRRGRWETE